MHNRPEPMSSLAAHVAWLEYWIKENNPAAPPWLGVKLVERGDKPLAVFDNEPYAPFIGEPVSLTEFEPRFNALRAAGYSWLYFRAAGKDGQDLIVALQHPAKPSGTPSDKVRIDYVGVPLAISALPDWQIKDCPDLTQIQEAYNAEGRCDIQTALKMFHQLADGGNPEAQWALGQRYEKGLPGVTKDKIEAIKWYRKAADQGFAFAMFNLGYLYEREQQYAEAIEWYCKATGLGDQDAPYRLGRMYEAGRGVKQDYAEALEWFYKSAENDFPEALMEISEWYENGKYLKQDYVQAYAWLAVSNTQDIHIQENRLNALREKMTPEQLVEAKRLVDGWKLPPIPTRE